MNEKNDTTISVSIGTFQSETYETDAGEPNKGDLSTTRSRDFKEVDESLNFIKSKMEEAIEQDFIYQFSVEIKLDK